MQRVSSRAAPAQITLEEQSTLMVGVDSFVRSNANFESSIPIDSALEEMKACTGAQQLFTIPLRHQLFSMDAALHWALFLEAICGGADAQPRTGTAWTDFSAKDALALLCTVYDVGVQEAIWDHFESVEDDEEMCE